MATVTYWIGMGLTAANVYPLNLVMQTAGAIMWTWSGWRMQDKPIMANEGVAMCLYGSGLLYALMFWRP